MSLIGKYIEMERGNRKEIVNYIFIVIEVGVIEWVGIIKVVIEKVINFEFLVFWGSYLVKVLM